MVSQVVEGMDESYEPHRLRISINGSWSVSDFGYLFDQLQQIYEIAQFGQTQVDGIIPLNLERADFVLRQERRRWFYDPELEAELDDEFGRVLLRNSIHRFLDGDVNELQVVRLSFASPGFMDIFGGGKAFAEVRKLILGVADRIIGIEDRKLAREEKRQDILAKKIKNMENLGRLSDKVGLDAEARRQIIQRGLEAQNLIESKILDGKITDVAEVDLRGTPFL
jgi:hypothetical protein